MQHDAARVQLPDDDTTVFLFFLRSRAQRFVARYADLIIFSPTALCKSRSRSTWPFRSMVIFCAASLSLLSFDSCRYVRWRRMQNTPSCMSC